MESGERYRSLEGLLEAHRLEGVDSEGQFTLNPARARELLEQFQLPDPAHYAMHITSFLIGAGAGTIEISSYRSHLQFKAHGVSLDESTIRSPFSVLLRGRSEPRLAELALGLNTILGQKGGEVVFTLDSWKARYTSQSIEVTSIEPVDHLTLICKPRCGGRDRELDLIDQAFRWSPVPITLNGVSVPEPRTRESARGLQIWLHNPEHPIAVSSNATNRLTKPVKAPFSALIQIGKFKPGFRIVCLGREYTRNLPWSFILPQWQVDITVASDRFSKDLSQQEILENELFHNLISSLRAQVEMATMLLLSHVPPLRGSEELVDDLVEHLFQSGQTEAAYAFQNRLCQQLSLGEASLEKGRAIYRLALMESSWNEEDSAKFELGTNILYNFRNIAPHEPDWSILKAEMAFSGSRLQDAKVERMANRESTPLEVQESCYRWLVGRNPEFHIPARAWHRLRLANCLYKSGRLEEALSQLDQSEREAATSADEELLLYSIELKAKVASQAGHLEKALELFGRHLSILRQTHGQYDLRLGLTLRRLAALLNHAGQKKQARKYLAWSKRLH